MKSIFTGIGIVSVVFGFILSAIPIQAALPAAVDISGMPLREGDLISASTYGDPDIYIVKFVPDPLALSTIWGYKRLFLSPTIFSMYGHLGGYANVRKVTPTVRDSFPTSGLFRNCETGDQKVWATEITGEDSGVLHHVQMTGAQAAAEDPRFFHKVFCINTREENFYPQSIHPYFRLADIPSYVRSVCTPLPACATSNPPTCAVKPAPGQTYCPGPIPPGCYYQEIVCITTPCDPILVCPSTTCTPRPACLDMNPACDMPEPADGWCSVVPGSGVTIQNVDLLIMESYPPQYSARITGYTPTPCYTLNHSTSRNGNRIDIVLSATEMPQANCIQVIQNFERSVSFSMAGASSGTYSLYVNGKLWTSFNHSGY
jgi:hypothetical protein